MTVHADVDAEVLERAFRTAMGNVAGGVAVVTTFDGETPHGSTVSAFVSLSMDPPMLLVSLANTSTLLSHIGLDSIVGVNVLAAHQDQIGLRFAQRRDDKFTDIAWRDQDGAPGLLDKHAYASLSVSQLVETGDHTLVIGHVQSAETYPGAPLTYWQRSFGTHKAF